MDGFRRGVAACIEVRRQALGITVSRLAGEVGCSRATINQLRAAKVGVGLRTLAAIAMVFACGADDIVDIESLAHVAPVPTPSVDIVRVLARNVTAMWPRRFANVEALARVPGISTGQLYVILDAGWRTAPRDRGRHRRRRNRSRAPRCSTSTSSFTARPAFPLPLTSVSVSVHRRGAVPARARAQAPQGVRSGKSGSRQEARRGWQADEGEKPGRARSGSRAREGVFGDMVDGEMFELDLPADFVDFVD